MVSVQNRSLLYAGLVPEGIHRAELVGVEAFTSAYGDRVGLVFRLPDHDDDEVMQTAAPGSRNGKLADLVRALGASGGTLEEARAVIGRRCLVAIRHGTTKAGKVYAGIEKTYRAG
jgi:hypothetical protein